jgi:hypothetical protein
MSNISLKALLEGPFKPVTFSNSGQVWTGQDAWNKWKRWADINKRNDYIYKVLNTIKDQKYQASERQQAVLDKWFRS